MDEKRIRVRCLSGELGVRMTLSEKCVRVCWLPYWLIVGGESAKAGMVTVVCWCWSSLSQHSRRALAVCCLVGKLPFGWIEELRRCGSDDHGLTIESREQCLCSLVMHCLCCFYSPGDKKIQIKKKKIRRHCMAQLQAGAAIFGSSYGKITKSVIIHTQTARTL